MTSAHCTWCKSTNHVIGKTWVPCPCCLKNVRLFTLSAQRHWCEQCESELRKVRRFLREHAARGWRVPVGEMRQRRAAA